MQKKFSNKIKQIEWPLFLACLGASAAGLWLISASTGAESERYLTVQLASLIIGAAAFLVLSIVPPTRLFPGWKLILLAEIAVIALLIPFGVGMELTGNKSWIRFELFGLSTGFQPGELAKVLYILSLSGHAAKLDLPGRWLDLVAFVLHAALPPVFLLVVSTDFGMIPSFAIIFVVIALAAGVKLKYFISTAVALGLFSPFIWSDLLLERQRERLSIMLDPSADALGMGYQTIQSVNAIISGGMHGSDIDRLTNLPARHTDFIFSVAGEKLGFVGCTIVLAMLVGLILRALWGTAFCGSFQGSLTCAGVAGMLIFQVFANIGMCLGISPVIGITLPFFSYGGTSAAVSFVAAGLVSAYRKT